MLDAGSDHGFSSVGPLNMPGHRLEMRLFPVDPRGGIGFIQHALSQSCAIAGSGIRRLPFADQPIFPINGDMRLIANPLNRAKRSSASKKPSCFIFHHSQSTQERWNHTESPKTREFFEPSICGGQHRLFIRFAKLGVWERLLKLVQEQRGVALGTTFLDGTNIRAHHKAAGAKKGSFFGRARPSGSTWLLSRRLWHESLRYRGWIWKSFRFCFGSRTGS